MEIPLPGGAERQRDGNPVDHCAATFGNVRLPYGALLQSDNGRLTPDGDFTSTLGSPRRRFLESIGRVTMGKLCMTAHGLGILLSLTLSGILEFPCAAAWSTGMIEGVLPTVAAVEVPVVPAPPFR